MENAVIKNDLTVQVVQKEGSIQFNNYEELKSEVKATLESYKGLQLTDDNKSEIKSKKAELNKVSKNLNDERIRIKSDFIKPLELFESQVKEITTLIKDAVETLDTQVKQQENQEKKEKEDRLRKHFDEFKALHENIDFVAFEDVNLNITLSASENKLKDEIKAFVDKVLLDLEEINSDVNQTRLLAKYRLSKDLQRSRIELNRELQQEQIAVQPKPEPIIQPTIKPVEKVIEVEEDITVEFTVTATRTQLVKLREYMKVEGIKYE